MLEIILVFFGFLLILAIPSTAEIVRVLAGIRAQLKRIADHMEQQDRG